MSQQHAVSYPEDLTPPPRGQVFRTGKVFRVSQADVPPGVRVRRGILRGVGTTSWVTTTY